MACICTSHSCFALALLLLTAGRAVAQDKVPTPALPDEPKTGLLSYKPLKPGPKDDELRQLQIARYNETIGEIKGLFELVLRGAKTPETLFDAGTRLCQCGLDVYEDPKDRIRLLADYLEFTKKVEKAFEAEHDMGRGFGSDWHMARYYRLDAEIRLLKAKRAVEKPKEK
jgi:hypothetical protein